MLVPRRTAIASPGTRRRKRNASTDTPTKPALADWIPEDALKEIAQERSKPEFDGESIEQYSRRMMEDALPQVTKGLINTAIHSTNDRIRFDAQRYLMERVLGKPGEDTANKGLTSLESLFKNMSEAAEQLTLEAAQATVAFDPAKVGEAQFRDAIEGAGFDVI